MTHNLVFCIAEEAILLAYEITNPEASMDDLGGPNSFYLVETHAVPVPHRPGSEKDSPDHEGQRFKQLKKDDPFKSEWIGASPEDCAAWMMSMQYRVNYIEQDRIVILDAQSARDGSVLVKMYVHKEGTELGDDGELGTFPEETDRWYDFRMKPQYIFKFFADLTHGFALNARPIYYGLKKELTDANGIFDYEKAVRIALGEEPGYDTEKIIDKMMKMPWDH